MDQIITAEAAENALPASTRAIQITERIRANGRTAVNAVCAIGKDLRTMKIDNLYTELGYTDFETYAEKEFDLRRRQAYQYISVFERLGEEFVQSNAQLGITKLSLLAMANPEDRAEVMETEDVNSMTTRQLEDLLDKYKQQGEQLSMLQEEKDELSKEKTDNGRMIHALEQKIKELEERNTELENSPKEVAVQEVQVPDKKTEKELKDTKKELKEREKELREAEERIKKLEDMSSMEASAVKAEYEGKILELQKKLQTAEKPAESSDKSNFKAMLASTYKELTGLIEYIKSSEPEDREEYMRAAYKIINASKDALNKIDPCMG